MEREGSIYLQIGEVVKETGTAGITMFEPSLPSNIEKSESDTDIANSVSPPPTSSNVAPEKKLTLFALQLAVLEKAATGLGTLGFIWATVVLLGVGVMSLNGSIKLHGSLPILELDSKVSWK
ncbi:hypothetical protein A2U01_0028201 [Trifolium medium]|uniref:Uncharacterized protein n=1 Tax=Trifolium medium TaxID=97028 RepID=A0A392P518_9FABA|nr:hypothetical protein [Trifolium medium]